MFSLGFYKNIFEAQIFKLKSFTRKKTMPIENPRIHIVVESLLYGMMHDIAQAEGLSLSALARDLIREALELRENVALAALAEEREKTFSRKKSLSYKQVWG